MEDGPARPDENGIPLSIVCRAGHDAQWTLVLQSSSADKAQVLCVSKATISKAGAPETISPLFVCQEVAKAIEPALEGQHGPCRGQPYLEDIRVLAQAARERFLVQAATDVA